MNQSSYFNNEKDFDNSPFTPLKRKISESSIESKASNNNIYLESILASTDNSTIKECQRITVKGTILGDLKISKGKLSFKPRENMPENTFIFGALVILY